MQRRGTGFTNVSKILEANRGSRIGQTISSGIENQAKNVRTGLQTAQQKFAEEEEKKKKQLEEQKQQQQQVLGRFTGAQPMNQQSGANQQPQSSPPAPDARPQATTGVPQQSGVMDRTEQPQATQAPAQPMTQQSGTQAPAQTPASRFANYSADQLREIQQKRQDYRQVLQNLGDTDYAAQLEEQRKQLASAQEGLKSISTDMALQLQTGRRAKDRAYAAQAAMQAEQKKVLETLNKLQMQREYQSFLDQYNDDEIEARLKEYESGAVKRGAAETFIPEEELKRLSSLSAPQYTGPTGLDLNTEIGAQTQQLQQLGGLVGSAGGREELLRRFVGGEGYSAGQKRLDKTIMSQEGSAPLRSAKGQISRIGQELQRSQGVAEARAEQLRSMTEAQGSQFKEQLGSQREQMINQLQSRLEQIQAGDQGLLGIPKQIQDILVSQEQKYLTDPTLKTQEDRLRQGLDMAKQQGIISERDAALLEGPGGLIERARQSGLGTQEINRLVAERIQSNINPAMATLGGVASNEELARIAALDRIMGKQGVDVGIPGAQDAYISGQTRLNMDSLMEAVKQQEQARLAQLTASMAFHAEGSNRRKNVAYDPTAFNRWLETQAQFLAPTTSDEDKKEKIDYDPRDVQKFMDRLKAASYNYKKEIQDSPLASKNREIGVMAQDLEKSKLGKESVIDTPNGKIVNYDNLGPKMLASIANLNERLKKMEGK